MEGGDAGSFAMPPAPAFASAEIAAEIVENYWMSIARDVSFLDYPTNPTIALAVADMNKLSDYRGVKPVTPDNLFRGVSDGVLVGPYLSQFWYSPVPFGAHSIDTRMAVKTPGVDYVTDWANFISIQNGVSPTG